MKKIFKYAACLLVGAVMTSCGGSGSDAKLFGGIPALYVEYLDAEEALKEKAKEMKSMDDFIALNSEHEKQKDEYKAKIEEAANEWTGCEVDLKSDEDFTVNTPITGTFTKFFSQSDMTAVYDLAGEVVAARDLFPESISKSMVSYYTSSPSAMASATERVFLHGYDAEGNLVVSAIVGNIQLALINDKVGVKAGTPVKLDNLQFSKKAAREYGKIETLKMGFKIKKK